MAENAAPKSYSSDPTLWLYTSLSSGSSQIVTATSRLETILKANRIPFKALDVATDEKARMLWGRRAGKRKLPGLVKMGMVVGDIDEIEEWNEYGELKEQVGAEVASTPIPAIALASKSTAKPTTTASSSSSVSKTTPVTVPAAPPVSSAGEAAAAAATKSGSDTPPRPKPTSSISFAPEKTKTEASSGAGGAQASMSMAMRQLGQEAAARAQKNKSDALAARKAQIAAAEKLDNAGPTGMPPPIVVADAATAISPETGSADAVSKADTVPVTENDTQASVTESDVKLNEAETASSPGEELATEDATVSGTSEPVSGGGEADTNAEQDTTAVTEEDQTTVSDNVKVADVTSTTNIATMTEKDKTTTETAEDVKDTDDTTTATTATRPESPLPASEETDKEITGEESLPALQPSESAVSESALPVSVGKVMESKPPTMHRGSSISTASKEEIERIEEENKIPEESEAEMGKEREQHVSFGGERPGEELERVKEELRDSSPSKTAVVDDEGIDSTIENNSKTASATSGAEKDTKTQEQPAAEASKALESVQD